MFENLGLGRAKVDSRFIIGSWLAAVSLICILLVVYSLSSYQFQMRLSQIENINLSTNPGMPSHNCDVSTLKIKDYEYGGVVSLPCLPNPVKYYSPGEALTLYKEVLVLPKLKEYSLQKRLHELDQSISNVKNDLESSQDSKELKSKLMFLQGNKFQVNLDLESLEKTKKEYMEKNSELIEVFYDIEYFDSSFKVISGIMGVESVWALPKPILEIILIISMGILGSLIFITVEFLKVNDSNDEVISMYIFRPFLGVTVALAIYVMAKSGQTAMGDGGENILSPFVISFLGIISGILAEQAYVKLTNAGRAVLDIKSD